MPVKLEAVRSFALALPDTTEEPHHHFGSFRVRGRIFVTIPPGDQLLHVLLPEHEREQALSMDPEFLAPLRWGSKVLGVRVQLPLARKSTVLALVRQAHAFKSSRSPAQRSAAAANPARRPPRKTA